MFSAPNLVVSAIGAALLALLLVRPGLMEYVQTGHVTLHWSRPLVAVFLLQIALLALIHSVIQKVVGLWKAQLGESGAR